MRRPDGPTARVLKFAAGRPGGVVTWSDAQYAYAQGVVPVRSDHGPQTRVRAAAAKHKLSISNVLRRHFVRVEGIRGMYVLSSTISNPDWDEDMEELQAFHDLYGADEFGMSTLSASQALAGAIDSIGTSVRAGAGYGFQRMSDIGSDWSGSGSLHRRWGL